MRRLILPAVYSRQASPDALAGAGLSALPHPLSQHQLDTFLALTRGGAPIVFNRAMTGDGKTLAGLLAVRVSLRDT